MANIISQTNKTTLVLAPNKTLAAQLYCFANTTGKTNTATIIINVFFEAVLLITTSFLTNCKAANSGGGYG